MNSNNTSSIVVGESLADEISSALEKERQSASDESKTELPHDPSYEVIPVFYHKLPKSTDRLAQKIREEARTLFLQKRSKELLDNNELKALWGLLQKNFTPPAINSEQFISYEDFLRVAKLAGDKFK